MTNRHEASQGVHFPKATMDPSSIITNRVQRNLPYLANNAFGKRTPGQVIHVHMVIHVQPPPPPPNETVLIAFYNIKWILFTSQSSHMAVAMLQQSSVRSVGRSQDLYPEEQALDIIPFVW